MNIPCQNCIVDVMCNQKCEKLASFIQYIDTTKNKKIPENLVINQNRYLRVAKCCNWSEMSYQLYVHLSIHIRKYLEGEAKKYG